VRLLRGFLGGGGRGGLYSWDFCVREDLLMTDEMTDVG
jgi:hypothetical protein